MEIPKTFKVHPNNLIVWPNYTTQILLWSVMDRVYAMPTWLSAAGYVILAFKVLGWLVTLHRSTYVDLFKPLKSQGDEE